MLERLFGKQKKPPVSYICHRGCERIEKILNPMFNIYIGSLSKDLNDKTAGLLFSSSVFQQASANRLTLNAYIT